MIDPVRKILGDRKSKNLRNVSRCCGEDIYRGTDGKQYCSNCNLEVFKSIKR